MTEIIIILFIYLIVGIANSLSIIGLHKIIKPGMILEWIAEIPLPQWLRTPLYECPTCMASIHSFIPFWITSYIITAGMVLTLKIIAVFVVFYIFYILTLAALNTIVYNSFFGED